jgi:hypothetical protein
MIERRGKADLRLRGKVAHGKLRLALPQQRFGGIEHALADRLAACCRFGLVDAHGNIYIMI